MVSEKLRRKGKPKQTAEEKVKLGKARYDWRYENSINNKKEYLVVSEQTWKYEPWRTNRVLSNFPDTILLSNEMNISYNIGEQEQYDFLYHTVRKGFRKFEKKESSIADFDLIQQYYKYNNERTREALRILSPTQIEQIRKRLERGGIV